MAERSDVETGGQAPYMILFQPQLRWDLGKFVSGSEDRILVGTELHVWLNKFGDPDADEVIPQVLVYTVSDRRRRRRAGTSRRRRCLA